MIKEPKEKIVISFSGGETSAYLIYWLMKNKPNHKYKIVFANTGEENEETLVFINQCEEYFKIKINWIEFDEKNGKPWYKEVDFKTAYRSENKEEIENGYPNHPYHKLLKRYKTEVNQNAPFCSSRLKKDTITRYLSNNGFKPNSYSVAIGIRADEIDRLGDYYYPLAIAGINKQMINNFWSKMPFKLKLKGYQGNCKTCFKKSFRKLATIAREAPEKYDFFKFIEDKYGFKFFREYKKTDDILKMAQNEKLELAQDDSINIQYQTSFFHDGTELDISNGCVESCEVF